MVNYSRFDPTAKDRVYYKSPSTTAQEVGNAISSAESRREGAVNLMKGHNVGTFRGQEPAFLGIYTDKKIDETVQREQSYGRADFSLGGKLAADHDQLKAAKRSIKDIEKDAAHPVSKAVYAYAKGDQYAADALWSQNGGAYTQLLGESERKMTKLLAEPGAVKTLVEKPWEMIELVGLDRGDKRDLRQLSEQSRAELADVRSTLDAVRRGLNDTGGDSQQAPAAAERNPKGQGRG